MPEKDADELLLSGEITTCDLVPEGSNYTFLVTLSANGTHLRAIYKPQRGEAPLWDFPSGTLYWREVAAYLTSEALGWHLVPATVIREGPYGLGAVQLFIDAQPDANYFTFRDERPTDLMRFALFDVLVNNADRKGGHCLMDREGRIWGIDHGLTFHADPKLRTVIWDYGGQPIPGPMRQALAGLQRKLRQPDGPVRALLDLLSPGETAALHRRLQRLLEAGVFPVPGPGRNIPWPPV
ncbi:MAG: SCO1664 family protein [Chloroflexi bacterium]|nr:SCO1664 family protein [Chloroflexota bacterium]